MKKLVLVLVSTVILTVFIAFNYLLWDRENKIKNFEYINDSKNTSIDALRAEISSLKDEKNQLIARISELENLNKDAQRKSTELEEEKSKINLQLFQKTEIISKLIQQGDFKQLEEIIKQWAEAVDKDQLENAFKLQYGHALSSDKNMTFEVYKKNYKDSVKNIKIKTVKLLSEDLPKDKKGNIIFKVGLEVKKVENSNSTLFNEGVNDRFFIMDFDIQKKEWVIVDILPSL